MLPGHVRLPEEDLLSYQMFNGKNKNAADPQVAVAGSRSQDHCAGP